MTDQLYDRLGGKEGIRSVVDDFYDALVEDPELGGFFEGANLEKLRQTQTDFLCEASGGSETYDAEPIREAHSHVPFEPSDIKRATEILKGTLEKHGVEEEDADAVVEAVASYERELLGE